MKTIGLAMAIVAAVSGLTYGVHDDCVVFDDCTLPAYDYYIGSGYCVVSDRAVSSELLMDCTGDLTAAEKSNPTQQQSPSTTHRQHRDQSQTVRQPQQLHGPQPTRSPATPLAGQHGSDQSRPPVPAMQTTGQPSLGTQTYANQTYAAQQSQASSSRTYVSQPLPAYPVQPTQVNFGASSFGFGAAPAPGGG